MKATKRKMMAKKIDLIHLHKHFGDLINRYLADSENYTIFELITDVEERVKNANKT